MARNKSAPGRVRRKREMRVHQVEEIERNQASISGGRRRGRMKFQQRKGKRWNKSAIG